MKHCMKAAGPKWVRAVVVTGVLVSISACQLKQPPSCDSLEVQNTLKSIVLNNAKESLVGSPGKDSAGQVRPGSAFFYNNAALSLSDVFDSGVNKDTKVRSCSATMHMKLPMNGKLLTLVSGIFGVKSAGVQADQDGGLRTKVDYDVRLDDKGEQFRVQSTSLNSLIELMSAGHALVSAKLRWSGRWEGRYQCERSAKAQELPPEIAAAHAPFQFSIDEQHMSGSEMLIERPTSSGGVEKLQVQFGGDAKVRIEGSNGPQDRWDGVLGGGLRGDRLEFKGLLRASNGQEIERCSMELVHTPLDERFMAEAMDSSD